jgi:uncharacterized protein YbaR (Trm112 family)
MVEDDDPARGKRVIDGVPHMMLTDARKKSSSVKMSP